MPVSPAASVPPLSPGEMQLLLSRAGLALNPGQVADPVDHATCAVCQSGEHGSVLCFRLIRAERVDQIDARDQALRRLSGLVIALVRARTEHFAREQARVALERHALRGRRSWTRVNDGRC